MKWNWGTKLVVAMAVFMTFIMILVFRSMNNVINLVEKDYYPKGLKYQDRLDEINNARVYTDLIIISQENDRISVQFPDIRPDTGTVYFFRPSNTALDKVYQIEIPESRMMSFDKSGFVKGKYLLKIYWKEKGKGYYIEKPWYFK